MAIRQHIVIIILLLLGAGELWTQTFPQLQFQKFYGKRGNDGAYCITESSDGYLYLGGFVQEKDGRGSCTNGWVVKVDEDGEQLWEKEIGGDGCDEIRSLSPTSDGGVIFAGVSGSFIDHFEKGKGDFRGDYLTGKLSAEGELVWMKTFGGLDIDQAFAVVDAKGDNFMVAGASNSSSFDVSTELPMTNLWVLRMNEEGLKKSDYVYGGSRHDWAYSAALCDNGDVLYAGFTDSEDIDGTARRANGDGWIMRVDRYGKPLWHRIYSGKFEDYFNDVAVDEDGKMLIVGSFESERKSKQFWFLKLTRDGRKIRERIFGGRGEEELTAVTPCWKDGYVATGYSSYYGLDNEFIKGQQDFWIIRFDRRGDIVWQQTFGGPDKEKGMDIIETSPGVFYAVGTKRNDFEAGGERDMKNDIWLLKVIDQDCKDVQVEFYTSLKDYNAYAGRAFKLKASVSEGIGYKWDFGDGNHSYHQNPQHTYEFPGVYRVSLTVKINETCSRTYFLPKLIMVW